MTWLRTKSPEEIRITALAMAQRKLAAGCQPCAAAYLDLARQHGATDAELAAAVPGDSIDEP